MSAVEHVPATPTAGGFLDRQTGDAIRLAVMQMGDRITDLAAQEEVDQLAVGTLALEAIHRDLGTVLRDAKAATARLIFAGVVGDGAVVQSGKKYQPPGCPVIEARGGSKSTGWESEALYRQVVERFMAPDPETGEVPSARDLAAELAEVLPVTTQSVQWRKTALKARGFDPKDWSETKEGAPSIQVHGGEK